MYRKLFSSTPEGVLTLFIDGEPVSAEVGETVAAVLLRQPRPFSRTTPVSKTARAPYCMMGVCFECIATVDGAPSMQTCMTEVRDGMRVERQKGRYDPADNVCCTNYPEA